MDEEIKPLGRYAPEDIFEAPLDLNTIVWRYMDFAKFVSLLQHSSLFLCRSDLLGDSFEGSYSLLNLHARKLGALSQGLPENAFELSATARQAIRQMIYINCWHANEHESVAMWQLYARSTESVAVRSTYRAIAEQLPRYHYFGNVRYVDYRIQLIPEGSAFWPYAFKRKAFEHEREMRIVTQAVTPGIVGSMMPLDLHRAIDSVHIAPNAARWFAELVQNVVERYGFSFPVHQSSLDEIGFI